MERMERLLSAMGATPAAAPASTAEFVTNLLSTRLPEFTYNPDNGCTCDVPLPSPAVVSSKRLPRSPLAVHKLFQRLAVRAPSSSSLPPVLQSFLEHFWDGWHLVKWFGNNLRKEAKQKDCAPLSVWYEKLKTHMWKAIEVGGGERIRHIFNTCLKHVQDVHVWAKEETTGRYTRCGHAPLESVVGSRPETIAEGTPAFQKLRQLVLNKTLQKDSARASPRGGTSVCESKNALDRLYCRKEIFYPLITYKLYAMLSTMHFNTLTLAELAGERREQRVVEVQRKYFTRTSRMVFKSPVQHLWRDQITQAVLEARQGYHEVPPDEVDIQAMIDAEAAFDGGEPEDLFEAFLSSDEDECEEEPSEEL
ncbi:hypothetical protein Y032_0010g1104 [Ancylostoma ceylanicum]|uniref:Uncharacterized protein n=1 Tax=Ancylostoma ceylanicum TaxID=53326 RepID=A0A016VFZ7_9BILA|nr:hypothetical protein Y032_0010g1104 [Ancylostoma ceylanicum]